MRRKYGITLMINGSRINSVIIDPHFEKKHAKSISDGVILKLVETLNGQNLEPVDVSPPYSYFVTDRIELGRKLYKLVWLLEDNQDYIGIVNAYRR